MARDSNGKAIIPDRRNDENLIILQFHKAVAQFHNKIVDYARSQGIRAEWVFETARRLTRWHYQWAVIHDFLPRFVGDELVGPTGAVYKEVAGKPPVINLTYYKPTNRDGRPFMPVEFAVAAYRFGHSLIRPFYVINGSGIVNIFGPAGERNLNGGRPIPADLVIDWKNILDVDGSGTARKPRKIDTKLSIPLATLPGSAVPPPDPTIHLAVRNTLPRKARRSAFGAAGREGDAGQRAVQRDARPQQRSGMGRRGTAVVLHPQGGRAAAVQRGATWAGGWPDHGRDAGRAAAAGPELLPVFERGLEARPTDRADDRPVHLRRPAEIRRCCLIAGAHPPVVE